MPLKFRRRMDRLRRSFRDSFRLSKQQRRREHYQTEASKPHQWQADEQAVRNGTCSFQVKYLGCVEVFESRGMHVCEEAFKVLKNSRKKAVRAILYVSGDALRVVDEESKGLIVDQTIEKVSFCAPDKHHERGFSYICRDGTTRRWMCHGFLALKESGERLSHAVGCAFAACLERKQKRDRDCVEVKFNEAGTSFARFGSFRQTSLTERLTDPQDCKPADPVPLKKVENPNAIERPHASVDMLARQTSFRGLATLNESSPFKRQLSLRVNELPSTLQRQDNFSSPSHSSTNGIGTSPIAEVSPENEESISSMCQQLSEGLTELSNTDVPHLGPQQYQQQKSLGEPGNPWTGGSLNSTTATVTTTNRNMSQQHVTAPQPFADFSKFSGSGDVPFSNNNRTGASVQGPSWVSMRSQSLDIKPSFPLTTSNHHPSAFSSTTTTSPPSLPSQQQPLAFDPFNAEWASAENKRKNNPFLTNSNTQAFKVQM